MADEAEENLDALLDSALQDFEDTSISKPSSTSRDTTSNKGSSAKKAEASDSTTKKAHEEGVSGAVERSENENEEENRIFEEALKNLNALGGDDKSNNLLGEGLGDGDEPVDMKLVEDFIKTLADQSPEELAASSAAANKGANTSASSGSSSGGGGGNGAGSNDSGSANGLEGMLEGIVSKLLSKEVFRGPMLQMQTAYAEWIPENENKVATDEMDRYKKQNQIVGQICSEYEKDGNFERVMVLLEEMQELGSPPKEIMERLSKEGVDTDMLNPGAPGGIGNGSAARNAEAEQLPPEFEKLNEECKVQ